MTDDRIGVVMEFIGHHQTGEILPLGKFIYAGNLVLVSQDLWKVAKQLVLALQFVHDQGYLLNTLNGDYMTRSWMSRWKSFDL